MKYLFTIAVVEAELAHDIEVLLGTDRELARLDGKKVVEDILRDTLRGRPDSIVFYRCLMDGWDATHRTLQRWVDHDRPKASEVWRKFVEDGVLLGGKEELRSLELMPRPTLDELERAVSFGLEDYAITAFVQTLYDAIDFVEATGAKLVAVARCIGMTMDDSEYTSIEF